MSKYLFQAFRLTPYINAYSVTFFLSIYLQEKKAFGVLAEINQSSSQETLKNGGQNTLWR